MAAQRRGAPGAGNGTTGLGIASDNEGSSSSVSSLASRFEQMSSASSAGPAVKGRGLRGPPSGLPPTRPLKPPQLRTPVACDGSGSQSRSDAGEDITLSADSEAAVGLATRRAGLALQASRAMSESDDQYNDLAEEAVPTPTQSTAPVPLSSSILNPLPRTHHQIPSLSAPVVPYFSRPTTSSASSSTMPSETTPSPTLSISSQMSSSSTHSSALRRKTPPPVPVPRISRSPSPLPSPGQVNMPPMDNEGESVEAVKEETLSVAHLAARFGSSVSRPSSAKGTASAGEWPQLRTQESSSSVATLRVAESESVATSPAMRASPRLPSRPHSRSIGSASSHSSRASSSPFDEGYNPFEIDLSPSTTPPALPDRTSIPEWSAAIKPISKGRPVPPTPPRPEPTRPAMFLVNETNAPAAVPSNVGPASAALQAVLSAPVPVILSSHAPPLPARKRSEPTVSWSSKSASAFDILPPPPPPPSRTPVVVRPRATTTVNPPPRTRQAGENLPTSRHPTPPGSSDLESSSEQWDAAQRPYVPPPPPVRAIPATEALSRRSSPPGGVRGQGPALDDSESEEDGADDEGVDAGGNGRRSQTEMPDATFANHRPPRVVPERKILSKHSISVSAIHGRYLVTGASHIKVWDTASGEAVGTVLLPKEDKVTALAFIGSTADVSEKLVWVGTKDGALHVVDIGQMQIVELKSNAHSHAIMGIFQSSSTICTTVDECGKTQIWTTSDPTAPPSLSSQPRTQRMTDKHTFVYAAGTQLWSAQGPHRHHAGVAARSPSIRVYDVSADSAFNTTPRPMYLPESAGLVGAVLAGTTIPSQPNLLYLAHDSGHVSLWERDSSVCVTTLRISNYAITALEGVLGNLWTGNREGVIHVYDVTESPWRVIKAWKASDEPITDLVLDLGYLNEFNKLHVASCGRENITFWDGTLKVDWLESIMLKREQEFSTYRSIKVLLLSWNIDSCKPSDLQGDVANMQFLDNALQSSLDGAIAGNNGEPPEIIAVGFQEIVDLEDRKITAKSMIMGKKKADSMFSDQVSHQYSRWHERLVQAVRTAMPATAPYSLVHADNMVGLFSCIFVRTSEKANLGDVAAMNVKTGMKGRYGNKGAICTRFVLDDSSICFLNCHLAAGQRAKRQRNKDLIDILENKTAFLQPSSAVPGVYINGPGQTVFEHEICFLAGDLNYRIDLTRSIVSANIRSNNLSLLREHDQLLKEMKYNQAFRLRSFCEGELTFPPTYKFDPGTDEYDSSAKMRIPAWCDRILYRTAGHAGSGKVTPLDYRSWPANPSDHKPITGLFQVRIKKMAQDKRHIVWEEAERSWLEREAKILADARQYHL